MALIVRSDIGPQQNFPSIMKMKARKMQKRLETCDVSLAHLS